jgi:hypothetical protein
VARELNEPELRAVCTLLYNTCVYTRTTFGKWRFSKHRPSQEELLQLGVRIKSAEDQLLRLVSVPPTSGHDMDIFIERLERDIEKVSQEQKETYK